MANVTGFRRIAVVDEETCKACLAANNSILADVNEIHIGCTNDNCRCYAIPVYITIDMECNRNG